MKKAFVLVCVLLLPVLSSAQTWLTGSVDDALAKAKADGKLLLIDFFVSGG